MGQVMAVCGALGGVAGAIGWAATRGLEKRNKPRATAIRTGIVAGAVALGSQLVTPPLEARRARAEIRSAGTTLFGSERLGDAYAEAMLPVVKDPRFAERLKAAAGGPKPDLAVTTDNPAAAGLAASGMMRLPLDDLAGALAVKRAMADSSPELCAGFWKGQISQSAFADALKRLTEAQQRQWISVLTRAMTLELAADGPPQKIPAIKVGEALKALSLTLPEDENKTLFRALRAGAGATPADACSAFHTLADRAASQPAETNELLVRMIATPDAVGD
jgi:hypothetical protein